MRPFPLPKPLVLCLSLALLIFSSVPVEAAIPVAGSGQVYPVYLPVITRDGAGASTTTATPLLVAYDQFVAAVGNGQAGVVRGVYVPGVLALSVLQQPSNNPTYISSQAGVVTQFQGAAAFGVIGLLAHNFASGAQFFNLAVGQEVRIVYGDGLARRYSVTTISRFQALDPNSPYSRFIDLDTGATLTSADIFARVYTGGDHVAFQTCIANNGLSTWGRLFVIATPLD